MEDKVLTVMMEGRKGSFFDCHATAKKYIDVLLAIPVTAMAGLYAGMVHAQGGDIRLPTIYVESSILANGIWQNVAHHVAAQHIKYYVERNPRAVRHLLLDEKDRLEEILSPKGQFAASCSFMMLSAIPAGVGYVVGRIVG